MNSPPPMVTIRRSPPVLRGLARVLRPRRNTLAARRQGRSSRHRDSARSNGPWGDKSKHKDAESFRFAFHNIKGLSKDPRHEKHDQLQADCRKYQLDYCGVSEVNLNFQVLPPNQLWKPRFQKWGTHTHHAYNRHTTSQKVTLHGGTGHLTSVFASHKVIASGEDPTGLGRWVWCRLQGRKGITARIISGYRPVPDTSNKPMTVSSQHQKYFYDNNMAGNPRQLFLDHLKTEIDLWKLAGDHIVLALDLNDDAWDSDAAAQIDSWGLKNAHRTRYPNLAKVATCNSNTNEIPIDGIWITPGLDIVAAGMEGFGSQNTVSDHRLLWVDIDLNSLFGFRPPPLSPITHAGIPMHDPQWGTKFNNKLTKERARLNIPNQIFYLEARARQGLFDTDDSFLFDQLLLQDDNLWAGIKKQLRKKYAGKVQFSDTVGHDRRLIQLYSLLLLRKQHRRVDRHKIRRLMEKTAITDGFCLTIAELEQRKAAARRQYTKHKNDAENLRQSFKKKVDTRRAHKYNTTVRAQEKITKNAFAQKAPFARIRTVLQNKLKTSMRTILYTDPQGTEHECTSQQEIELACMNEGQARYSQTHNTPFLTEPLISEIGLLGNQTAVNEILNGTFQPPTDLDAFTIQFIKELKRSPEIPDIPLINADCTTAEHIHGWKKMKARTSASTFGPSFSEYIIGSDREDIAEVDAAIASIPALTGHCPQPWSTAIDVMIPKKTSSNHVKKLRIIVLFHALFNMLNKRMARRLISHAEQTNQIPCEAYGSRHNFRANDCGLNKTLSTDISRQQKRPFALCSNDAKSCYDRIVHSVASICMQRLGATPQTCRAMFGTLQQLEHHVKTAYGTSASNYGSIGLPLQGVLQGNGAGPAIWLVVSIPIINMLRAKGFGFRSINTITGETYRFVCYTFVDDTDLIHNGTADSTITDIVTEMQEMLDTWSGGLRASGGVLVPAKSYWYAIDFQWNQAKLTWDYVPMEDIPGVLRLHHPDGSSHELERLDASEARETLGIWLAMDGNQDAQVLALYDKIITWADRIRTKQLSKSDAWLSLRLGIAKSLRYPLTATNLSKAECTHLDKELLDVALPAIGIPRRYASNIIHGSRKALGLGIPRLWDDQGTDHISALLRHGDGPATDITAYLFNDLMATLQIELGLPGYPFEHSYKKFHKCTTHTYATSTWEFCQDYNFIIKTATTLKLLRENDAFLMLEFAKAGYTPTQLMKLNLCRMWARVITLADITTGDGHFLKPGVLHPPFQNFNPQSITWPKVGTPSTTCWNLWVEAISECFLQPDDRYNHKRLRKPLGRWYTAPFEWPWYLSADETELFVYRPARSQWQRYSPKLERTQRQRPTFQPTQDYHTHRPPHLQPTTVSGRYFLQTGGIAEVAHQLTPDELSTQATATWWKEEWHTSTRFDLLCQGITNGTAICVTDGSFKKTSGSAAYVILPSLNSPHSWVFTNHTPGPGSSMDAYRAELGGIYGCVAFINELCHTYELTGMVTMACDCQSALTNIFDHTYDKPSQPHFDMVHQLRRMVADSPVQWNPRHVQAHQDDHQHYSTLDQWAKLNVDMDALAKYHWITIHNEDRPAYSLPHAHTWSLWRGNQRITDWSEDTALQLIYTNPLRQTWRNYQHIGNRVPIAWNPLYRSYARIPAYKQLWLSKWMANWAPIGKNLQRWKISPTDTCPRCGNPERSRHHVLRCPNRQATSIWETAIDKLDQWLGDNHTEPFLRTHLIHALKTWHSSDTTPLPTAGTPAVLATIQLQDEVGWDRLLDGFLVHGWIATQHEYLQSIGKRTTGERWASRLIIRLWEIAWEQWRHRQKIARSLDSQELLELTERLDAKIQAFFDAYHQHPRPILQRWFSQSIAQVSEESVDFKQQWLDLITSAQRYSHE